MDKHINLLGILLAVSGGLDLAVASLILVIFVGTGSFVGLESGDTGIAFLVGSIGVAIAALIFISAVVSFIAAYGLLKYKPWARPMGLVASILHLPAIPIDTALGIYGIWVLLKDETIQLLNAGQPPR